MPQVLARHSTSVKILQLYVKFLQVLQRFCDGAGWRAGCLLPFSHLSSRLHAPLHAGPMPQMAYVSSVPQRMVTALFLCCLRINICILHLLTLIITHGCIPLL
jgi:hypothetical protein